MDKSLRLPLLLFSLTLPVSMLLTGCSTNFQPSPVASEDSSQTPIGNIVGAVHGGNLPVTGASIFLFAAGTGGYGTASTSLITKGKSGVSCNGANATLNGKAFAGYGGACYVTTDQYGNFALSGDYTCTPGQQVYMVAVGGNPGLTGTVNNTYLVQMAGMGQCPSAGNLAAQVPFIDIDEITTVGFAYSMENFGSDAFDIATDGTTNGAAAIQLAMANAINVVDIGHGQSPATTLAAGSAGTLPSSKIVYLADILATCVNTTGTLNTGTNRNPSYQPCYSLLEYGGATFTGTGKNEKSTSDESQAIFYIAQNPTSNVAAIYNLLPSTPVWATNLAQPTDWTMPVVYKGVVGSRPGNIAFDANGNAWVSDRTNNGVVKITPTGVVTKLTNLNNGGSNGSIYQVAVDPSNNIWALDNTYSQIYRMNSTGAWESTVTGNQLSSPISLSFNASGSAFVLNSGNNYISEFSASGVAQTPATYNQAGYGMLGTPQGIAVDSASNAYLPEDGGNCACVGIIAAGATIEYAFRDYSGTVASASAVAVDGSDNAWQAQTSNNSIVEDQAYAGGNYQNYNLSIFGYSTLQGYYFNLLNIFGIPFASNVTALTGGGLNQPVALTFDGAGHLWAANSGASTVSGFNGTATLAGTSGLQTGSSGVTYGVAADLAGNLWTANSDGTVTELLGAATPTTTPVYPGQIAVKP